MKICEICDKQTKKWNFPCRDEHGILDDVEIICKECHDGWCICNCPRKKIKDIRNE